MDIMEESSKHIVFDKCTQCPYVSGSYWRLRGKKKGRIFCHHPKRRGLNAIELKGKKFPKDCPADDYITERCDKIQLKRKKMLDKVKQKKKCKR